VTPGRYPLQLYRGDTYRWKFQLWADPERTQPADLTDVEARAQIRERPGGQTVVDLQCTITLPNIIDMLLDHAGSVRLPERTGAWDLQLTYAAGDVSTVLAGPVTVTQDVTDSDQPAPAPADPVRIMPRMVRRQS